MGSMNIVLQLAEKNLAHSDYRIFLDGTLSGIIRLWTEEIPSFMLFVQMWNGQPENEVKRLTGKSDKHMALLEATPQDTLERLKKL